MARSLALVASRPVNESERIAAFERWVEDHVAGRSEPWRFGTALFDDDHPVKWDANVLRVERALGSATAEDLAREAERLQAHLGHRAIRFPDDAEGARVTAAFAAMGWTADRSVAMALHRGPDRPAPAADVAEVDRARIEDLLLELDRRAYPADAEALDAFDRVFHERIGARFFAATVDGEPVGKCELYQRDGVAQIESVDTLEEHRNRGLARAFLTAAIEAAREAGAELIFIVADDADWPKHLYAKLGFDEVRRSRQFTRPPAGP